MFEYLTNLNGFKKNKDGGIDMSENKKEVIPMFTRIQNLYNKLDILKFDCTLVKEGFKAHKLEQLIFDYFEESSFYSVVVSIKSVKSCYH